MQRMLMLSIIVLGGFGAMACTWVPDQDGDGYSDLQVGWGIHVAPDGQASYIEGEACTINTDLNQTRDGMKRAMVWCFDHYEMDREKNQSYYEGR